MSSRYGRFVHMQGQAAVELALILPILLFLVAAFLAMMVQIQIITKVQSATSLAAAATIAAPANDQAHSCRYATATLIGTLLGPNDWGNPLCDTLTGPDWLGITSTGALTVSKFSCYSDDGTGHGYLNGGNPSQGVLCITKGSVDLSQTPIGWAVPWKQSFVIQGVAVPPDSNGRQNCVPPPCAP